MQCPRCQQDNPIHARLCLGCGALLALVCGACGADLPATTHSPAARRLRQSGPRLTGVTFGPFDDVRRWSIATPRRLADE